MNFHVIKIKESKPVINIFVILNQIKYLQSQQLFLLHLQLSAENRFKAFPALLICQYFENPRPFTISAVLVSNCRNMHWLVYDKNDEIISFQNRKYVECESWFWKLLWLYFYAGSTGIYFHCRDIAILFQKKSYSGLSKLVRLLPYSSAIRQAYETLCFLNYYLHCIMQNIYLWLLDIKHWKQGITTEDFDL